MSRWTNVRTENCPECAGTGRRRDGTYIAHVYVPCWLCRSWERHWDAA